MHENDPADLDGDGRFDAIDIEILEDGGDQGGSKMANQGKSGCCVLLFAIGSIGAAGWCSLNHYLI